MNIKSRSGILVLRGGGQKFAEKPKNRKTELKTMARTIRDKLDVIVTYWTFRRISNAKMEGFNNKIRWLTKQAYGFRDREYFKLKIYQFADELDEVIKERDELKNTLANEAAEKGKDKKHLTLPQAAAMLGLSSEDFLIEDEDTDSDLKLSIPGDRIFSDADENNKKSSTSAKSSTGISQPFPDYRGLPNNEQNIASAALQSIEHDHNIASNNNIVNQAIDEIKTDQESI